jgi:hypothetical protein
MSEDILPGSVVLFTYRPLFRRERHYRCKAISVGRRSFVGEVLHIQPPPFFRGNNDTPFNDTPFVPRKRFWFSRMGKYPVYEPPKGPGLNPIGEAMMDVPYRDRHGIDMCLETSPLLGDAPEETYRDEHRMER